MDGQRTVRSRSVLIALAAAVILGLLGMHVLGGHDSAHGRSADGGHADAPAAAAAHAHADSAAASAQAHADPTVAPATCAGCADLPAATTACVLALLGGILLLVLPVSWRMPSPPARPLARVRADVARPRAPSLHVLCISRT